jgi:hypothetical protein
MTPPLRDGVGGIMENDTSVVLESSNGGKSTHEMSFDDSQLVK